MTFRDWQHLSPAEAAHEFHARIQTRLAAPQRRAVLAQLQPEPELAASLAASRGGGPLAGVPCLVKDLFDVAGWPTFAGSTFLPEVRATPASHGAFVRAVTGTGAVVAGKTHLHEFAYGITGENPHYGDCEHPRFPGRTTGGSSSGSAAAVAAGLVPLALGSDTGGSVRVPAAYCGLYGLRLAPRDPWIRDAVALAPSFDTAGWFTATADDMRATVDALIGPRPAARAPRGCFLDMSGLDAEVATAFRASAVRLAPSATPGVRQELLHAFALGADAYNTTVAMEAWAAHRMWAERYRERYSEAVWQRLNRVQTLGPAQAEAADLASIAIRAAWDRYFAAYDFLILPASPTPAPTKAECTPEHRQRILTLTAPASIGGLPVLTLPVLLPSGLTTGLQLVVRDAASPAIPWALEQWREGDGR